MKTTPTMYAFCAIVCALNVSIYYARYFLRARGYPVHYLWKNPYGDFAFLREFIENTNSDEERQKARTVLKVMTTLYALFFMGIPFFFWSGLSAAAK